MGFDVVRIELEDREVLTRIDKYNDLVDALRKLAEPKETSSGGGEILLPKKREWDQVR